MGLYLICLFRYSSIQYGCFYLSVGPKASLSRWRCSLWSLGASRDQEQERSKVALGPWWGDGESTRPTVAFFTVPPQRAEEQNAQFEFVSGVSFTKSEMK